MLLQIIKSRFKLFHLSVIALMIVSANHTRIENCKYNLPLSVFESSNCYVLCASPAGSNVCAPHRIIIIILITIRYTHNIIHRLWIVLPAHARCSGSYYPTSQDHDYCYSLYSQTQSFEQTAITYYAIFTRNQHPNEPHRTAIDLDLETASVETT